MKRRIITISIAMFSIAVFVSGLGGAMGVFAASTECPPGQIGLQIALPMSGLKCVTGLSQYIIEIYRFFVGTLGVIAVIVMMVGGFQWLMAGGNSQRIEEAKTTILSALGGLVIGLSSYMILNIINPNLTELKVGAIPPITPRYQLFQECENTSDFQCGTYYELDSKTLKPGPTSQTYQGGQANKKIIQDAAKKSKMCRGIYCTADSKSDPTVITHVGGCYPELKSKIDFGDAYSCKTLLCQPTNTNNGCDYYNDSSIYNVTAGSAVDFKIFACENNLCQYNVGTKGCVYEGLFGEQSTFRNVFGFAVKCRTAD